MNLARHAAVLWRFRAVTAAGAVIGIVLTVLASYSVSLDGGPSLKARGMSTWSSESALLVTQPGFPEGRIVLPTSPPVEAADPPKDRLEYGDPNRFNTLTDLYSQLATSDEVLRRIPGRPKATQIDATPVPGLAGSPVLPIIKLTTVAPTAERARELNMQTAAALRSLLSDEQDKAEIGDKQRVELQTLNAPSRSIETAGPTHTASILALLLCAIGTIAVTHLLAALRPRLEVAEPDELAFPWRAIGDDPVEFEDADEPELEPERSVSSGGRRSQ